MSGSGLKAGDRSLQAVKALELRHTGSPEQSDGGPTGETGAAWRGPCRGGPWGGVWEHGEGRGRQVQAGGAFLVMSWKGQTQPTPCRGAAEPGRREVLGDLGTLVVTGKGSGAERLAGEVYFRRRAAGIERRGGWDETMGHKGSMLLWLRAVWVVRGK